MKKTVPPEKLAPIRLVILDVDGVLTDGRIHYGLEEESVKSFNTQDGLGIKMLRHVGIEVGVITARRSRPLARRMRDLGVKHLIDQCEAKGPATRALLKELGVAPEEALGMGDDILDFKIFDEVGLAAAPSDAHPLALERADLITLRSGGRGAVRELADEILKSRFDLRALVREYLDTLE